MKSLVMEKFGMTVAASFLHIVMLSSTLLSAQSTEQDYRYMRSVKNASDMPLVAQYDYIVIGGGTAGCPLAATLSGNYSVLLLERGGVPLEYPDVLSAASYLTVLRQDDDGTTPAQKFTSEDGVENWRGRILGGTSMINGAFYSRANPEFYQSSGINWEMNVVEESYEWVEETVAHNNQLSQWSSLAKQALLQANVTPDNNYTLDHLIGTKASASTYDASSRRFGAVELLNKANFTNLRVAVRASVDRLIFSPNTKGFIETVRILCNNMVPAALQLLLLVSLLQSNLLSIFAQSSEQDFSYMKSVKNATDMPVEAEYDYIIVGGGTAGCPLAATLSEKYSVLVLERGGVPLDYPDVLNAAGFETILGLEDDGNTPSQGFISEDGVDNARARILGGGSMINGGFYSRADPPFYPKSGIDWDMNVVRDSYRWVEQTVAKKSDLFPWNSEVRDALLQANVVPDNGFTVDHLVGTKVSASTFDGSGNRFGAVELLNKGNLTNLVVAVHASVDRIIFSSSNSNSNSNLSVKGVKYTDSEGRSHEAMIRNGGEVILSAGALGSPQLLMLSGVGPKSYLSSLNISVLLDQPYVGEFVYDNPCNVIAFTSTLPINGSFIQVAGITNMDTFIETRSNPSVALLFTKVGGSLLSTGSFSLASPTNVTVTPNVRYNYYSDPSDLGRCVSIIRKVGEVLNTPSMDKFKTTNSTTGVRDYVFFGTVPPTNQSSDAHVEDYCRSTVTTIWHYHGGCTAGKVVDGRLRVKGIGGLRVVDGSTFTVSPGTNPQATLFMLGRYIGLGILKQRMA